jgi:nickel transport system substrate-binding protein
VGIADVALNQYDVMVRNEHYWGEKPALSKVTVKVIPDPTSARWPLKPAISICFTATKGCCRWIPSARLARTRPGVPSSPPVETVMLALNSAKAPTNELAVREALNYAVNKKSLIDNALYGTQRWPTRCSPPPCRTPILA